MVDKSGTLCITLEVIYIQCALIDSEKIGRLMMIICDPVALCLIFICLVPIFIKNILKIKINKC